MRKRWDLGPDHPDGTGVPPDAAFNYVPLVCQPIGRLGLAGRERGAHPALGFLAYGAQAGKGKESPGGPAGSGPVP